MRGTVGRLADDVFVERVPIGADGRSGSRLERVRARDGATFVVKRSGLAYDRAAQVTGHSGREAQLFLSGTLARVPGPAAHALLDAWQDGHE